MATATPPQAFESPEATPTGIAPTSAEAIADTLFEAETRALAEAPLRRPATTYRLQVHGGFRLEDVVRIVDYLDALGITDCYLSPFFDARPGSTHGYDVFDPGRINPEIGDEQAHDHLVAALRDRGMGRVLDVVPNHMGIGGANRFWNDVLETGPQAESAPFFDIDWSPVKDELEGRVLLPILEDLYGKVLEAGLFAIERDGGSFWLRYRNHRLPMEPRSYSQILGRRADEFLARFDHDEDDVLEYLSILDAIKHLPSRRARDPNLIERVRREKEAIKRRIHRLCAESSLLRAFLDENLASLQGKEGDPASFDALHRLLEDQVFRLAYWRVASEEINYRRFFDVTELAGLRTEDPKVFELIHSLILRWVREGGVTGLRIDHPDGLADPLGYFRRLQERLFLQSCHKRLAEEGNERQWPEVVGYLRARYWTEVLENPGSPLARRFPVVAEKILSRGETLPNDWPIDGTVGYEFLNALNGLFVDPNGSDPINTIYREFTGDVEPFDELLNVSKQLIEDRLLASELTALTRQLNRVAELDRRSRDFTLADLFRALREVIACFRIYRTFVQPGEPVAPHDRDAIEQAIARARHRRPSINDLVYDFIQDVLQLKLPERLKPEERAVGEKFVIRFQQVTGPVQAKGLEDTAFYRQVPLVSLNEVGGDPGRFGVSPGVFHALNDHRLNHWPGGLSTTATHDTKRGEDARIRIDVLSELPDEWKTGLTRWSRWNARKKGEHHGAAVPDAREEYLLYQTLIGAWPFEGPDDAAPPGFVTRVQDYLVKAAREAKRNTSWTDSDLTYADRLRQFVAEILEGPDSATFLKTFLPFQRRVARVGVVHSLAQTLLKHASPGVADLYQGCELWDLNLVDPDNRRPVDYEHRRRLLVSIRAQIAAGRPRAELAQALFENPDDGAIKLYLTWTVLNHRKANLGLYQQGSYRPLEAVGDLRGNVVAFLRRHQGQSVLAVAPRLVARLMGDEGTIPPVGRAVWCDTKLILPDMALPPRWRNLLTDRTFAVQTADDRPTLDLAEVFQDLPIALLVEEPDRSPM
jgi:(1->4)-alpha-D-glucan 1-alpha-D-glucosylmutase